MRILVIGSGGREHAICWALSNSPGVSKLYCAPGNAGTTEIAQNVDIAASDTEELISFAKNVDINLTICPMEEPLVNGIADAFAQAGLALFGPSRDAAHIEGSKAYAKDFMRKYRIPAAKSEAFDNFHDAMAYVTSLRFPCVIKADGLAAGKGVIICPNAETADRALHQILSDRKFGDAGNKVLVEEFLEGIECSVLAFCDGESIVPMPGAKDHKAAFDGDRGPNTGGMGVYTPCPQYTEEIAKECMKKIFLPTIKGLREEDREFVGVLYFGLMLTEDGPKMLEYNCRPGDPETQALLPLLETDLLKVMLACMNKKLDNMEIKWKNNAVCCVVAASGGYPEAYKVGYPIVGLSIDIEDVKIFHSGTRADKGNVLTNGGRVLSVVASGTDLENARSKAYEALSNIRFRDMKFRKDIGDLTPRNMEIP